MAHGTPRRITLTNGDNPAQEIIRAVSSLTNAERGGLAPLYSAIDPDALNKLYQNSTETTISFEYEGFHITVHSGGDILLRDPESTYATLNTASNILLIAPSSDDTDQCVELLHPSPVEDVNVLGILVEKDVDEKAYSWMDLEQPANRKIISLGEFARSTGTQSISMPGSIVLDLIGDDQDLSTLKERVTRSMTEWQSDQNQTTVCFESIDDLIVDFGMGTAISFIRYLQFQIEETDSIAHYHLDPLKCDQEEVNSLIPLFDAVVYEDQECTVRM